MAYKNPRQTPISRIHGGKVVHIKYQSNRVAVCPAILSVSSN